MKKLKKKEFHNKIKYNTYFFVSFLKCCTDILAQYFIHTNICTNGMAKYEGRLVERAAVAMVTGTVYSIYKVKDQQQPAEPTCGLQDRGRSSG